MLGVTAHYLDEQLRVKTVLLGLRPMYGAHSGVAIAEELLTVMRDSKISDRIEYFVAANASNIDTALRQIAKEIDVDPLRQRIRCSAYILNLVAKAILYGTDSDCVTDAAKLASRFDSCGSGVALTNAVKPVQSRNDSVSLAAWRKRGALGLCHNLVYHVRGSPRRRRHSESKQHEISDSRIYQLVANGGVRWNSDLEMIERALKLKDALQLSSIRIIMPTTMRISSITKTASVRRIGMDSRSCCYSRSNMLLSDARQCRSTDTMVLSGKR